MCIRDRDYLLREIDENFTLEGIQISYPTEVEISIDESDDFDDGKAERQNLAKERMLIEEKRFQTERENAKSRLKQLEEEIDKSETRGEKVSDLEFEAQALENELNTFEREG